MSKQVFPEYASLSAALMDRADRDGDRTAFRFVDASDGGPVETPVSFGELHDRASAIGARLAALADPGDRALILCPPGADYVASLFGCFYAGLVAVPAYPPLAEGREGRLESLVADAEPRVLLTTAVLKGFYSAQTLERAAGQASSVVLSVDEIAGSGESGALLGVGDGTAMLQYTSGSTGEPRGVILSHRNLLANVRAFESRLRTTDEDTGVLWLPPYHDMGLIGGIFASVVAGVETVSISPLLFLRDPLLWLDTISQHRGTISGAPNFAYEVCVRKATPERVAQLDLSSWRVAVNGAEPVRSATMERFAACFGPCGFDAGAFMPAYGLAEATLMVSGRKTDAGAPAEQSSGSGPDASPFAVVSSGVAIEGTDVVIVDPIERTRCADGSEGEIWVAGPCVSEGYWNAGGATKETFGARIAADDGDLGYLRTGDLGFVRDGELFVSGRLKDLIIVRGRNHYPQDLESTAGGVDRRLRPGCGAAFEVDRDGVQRLVLVQECAVIPDDDEAAELVGQVRRAISVTHGVALDEVVLIRRGTSLKTSSGKIRRRPTRDAYLAGQLDVVGRGESGGRAPALSEDDTAATADAEAVILELFREVLEPESLGAHDDFFALGGDSLDVVQLAAAIEDRLGVPIEPDDVYRWPTPRLLAAQLVAAHGLELRQGAGEPSALVVSLRSPIPRIDDAPDYPLSPIQRRWATDYLGDRSKTWGNLSVRIPLPDAGSLDSARAAIDEVWARHESLRTVFPVGDDGQLRQRVLERAEVPTSLRDLTDLAPEERYAAAGGVVAAEASGVFDLAAGPAARAAVIRTGDDSSELHLALHHMLADGWSVMRLRQEIAASYGGIVGHGKPAAIATPPVRYRDYTAWMLEMENGHGLDSSRDYWLRQLDGDLAEPFTVDHAVAAGPETKGASVLRILPTALAHRIHQGATARRASVTALFYAAFFDAVRSGTGRNDLIIGTPLAGRDRDDIRDVVGMFINLVPIRMRFRRGWDFGGLLDATRTQLLGAMVHQRYQLDRLTDDLGVVRDDHQFPITNTFFTKMEMPGLSLGEQSGAVRTQKMSTDVRFHVMFYVYEFTDGLVVECKYRDALFDSREIEHLVDHCVQLLESNV